MRQANHCDQLIVKLALMMSTTRIFYDQLDDLLSSIPKHTTFSIQLVIGDMNAQVGNDTTTWKPALGGHAEAEGAFE